MQSLKNLGQTLKKKNVTLRKIASITFQTATIDITNMVNFEPIKTANVNLLKTLALCFSS